MTTDRFTTIRQALRDLPAALAPVFEERLETFYDRHAGGDCSWLDAALRSDQWARQLVRVWGCSQFVFDTCLEQPEQFRELVESGDLERSYSAGHYAQRLSGGGEITGEQDLHRQLRQLRRREMLRIVWRDFNRMAPLLETTGDVTRLAEYCIHQALAVLHPLVESQLGTPVGKFSGEPQHMLVLGMGKMGAWELNVSSDIDLIFSYPEGGETRNGRKVVSNQEFFVRLGQKLIQALDNKTVDGFVFRVDMRLRPYGESGALAMNFDALEEYYQAQGRDWERYAMIKARVVAGQPSQAGALMAILRPFTYRRYIDFSAIQSLRDMKSLINREVARLGITDDVKKSAGGIREVEFIAQAFQLIRGGKDTEFQNPRLQDILELLAREELLPDGMADNLWQAYQFLRNTEHVLQGMNDRQTQTLPTGGSARAIVAHVMGCEDWDEFYRQLEAHRSIVKTVFQGIAAPSSSEVERGGATAAATLWRDAIDAASLASGLENLGYRDVGDVAGRLFTLRESRAVAAMTNSVRERFDRFIPLLIDCSAKLDNGTETLARILPLVESILRRSAYLVLMNENPDALRQLVYLCSQSRWIAEQISQYPALLDELLDVRTLFTPADKQSIAQDLRQQLLRTSEDDLEAQMEALRYFRRAEGLRIAACEVEGALPLMKVSDNLTWLAEVIVDKVLTMAWRWMIERHGRPGAAEGVTPSLLVIGYGKLGGIELGHGSDLDLVFLHNADASLDSDGERSLDNNSYFARLCQRMIHILSTRTLGGDLYEVDTRLRPNGNSGLLVTSLGAFEKYQLENAWTWEHQALLRARVVAGDSELAAQFEDIRRRVLAMEREPATLRTDVVEMREKMRSHLGSKGKPDQFHLKQDAGGMVDIEFIVQFIVLRHAHRFPELTTYTDNIRILEAIAARGLLTSQQVRDLTETYIFYRSMGHRLNLQGQSNLVALDEISARRQLVQSIWTEVFASGQGS
jgi:[glutamine synthetase] adenylyltransferase / [glutamine synthetase]-adenylyl-L-tyrosine phosphorylase